MQPVLHPQSCDPTEFVHIVGNEDETGLQGMSGDQQVVGSDRRSGSLQLESYLRVSPIGPGVEGQDGQRG